MTPGPNWAEQVTAIGTAVGALGLLGAIGAAVFAGRQVSESRQARQAGIGAEFIRRWNEDALVETRRLIAQFKTKEDLATAFERYVATNATEASMLYRELDYFEQLAALERVGAVDFELVKILSGRLLVERWEMWKPSLDAVHGERVYPLFESMAAKMRVSLGFPHRH